jgi:hypothetical protein
MTDEHTGPQRRRGWLYDPAAPLPPHLTPSAEPEVRHRLKDVDSAAQAFRIQALGYAGWLGILGMFVGMAISLRTGWNMLLCVGGGFALGTAIAAAIGIGLAQKVGAVASAIYMPSGASTPLPPQYSLAEALIASGRPEAAAAELMQCAALLPQAPEPLLRLARLSRDELRDTDRAIYWFRRVLALHALPTATKIAATRELIELFTHRLGTPARALPDLARLAAEHPDTPAGRWAARELADIRRTLRNAGDNG